MKRIFTLITFTLLMLQSNAQLILNEFYAIPNSGNHEFFELYNSDVSVQSADNYTMITYFEEGPSTRGFYVLDMPAQMVAPLGYYVGAAANPFNYQGNLNCLAANFNWNDLAFLAANNGYLRKWVQATAVPAIIDGNANYDLGTIPANFNDFFFKKGGGNASYTVFLYRNGTLVQTFLGGIGGTTTVPSYITNRPDLYVDMLGTAADFTIPFSTYASSATESVIQEAGSDNGYIRLRDGYCGLWTKSSSQVTHSPGVTNGDDGDIPPFTVAVSSVIVKGSALTGSNVFYDVEAATLGTLPVTLHIFTDVGSNAGTLDADDVLVDTRIETAVNDGDQVTNFTPFNAGIIIVVKTAAGCIDRMLYIPNTGVLPVQLKHFSVDVSGNSNKLSWKVSENASAARFTVERSSDGRNFSTIAELMPSTSLHDAQYEYADLSSDAAYYRIRITDKENKIIYSSIVAAKRNANTNSITLRSNPVQSQLNFSLHADADGPAQVQIYNTAGALVMKQIVNVKKGSNAMQFNLRADLLPGLYLLEAGTGSSVQTVRFMKSR